MPPNRNARCGIDPDPLPQVLAVELADIDAVDAHGAAGHVVEAREEVDQRGLPLPVEPTMAVVSPGRAWNEMLRSTGLLGARVAERDVAELDLAAAERGDRRRAGRRWWARCPAPRGSARPRRPPAGP